MFLELTEKKKKRKTFDSFCFILVLLKLVQLLVYFSNITASDILAYQFSVDIPK